MAKSSHGPDDIVARQIFLGKAADGSSVTITVEIGRPFPWGGTSPTEWACWARVDPFVSRDVHGEGSLQALCLASQLVRSELSMFEEKGGVLMAEDGGRYTLTAYWPLEPY